jgi:hypothetical protein
MREQSSTARAEIPASANISDVIFRRAKAEPDAVMLRQRTGAGRRQDVTAAPSRMLSPAPWLGRFELAPLGRLEVAPPRSHGVAVGLIWPHP